MLRARIIHWVSQRLTDLGMWGDTNLGYHRFWNWCYETGGSMEEYSDRVHYAYKSGSAELFQLHRMGW